MALWLIRNSFRIVVLLCNPVYIRYIHPPTHARTHSMPLIQPLVAAICGGTAACADTPRRPYPRCGRLPQCFPGTFCPGPCYCHFRKLCSAKLEQLEWKWFHSERKDHAWNFNASLPLRRCAIDERCYPLFRLCGYRPSYTYSFFLHSLWLTPLSTVISLSL